MLVLNLPSAGVGLGLLTQSVYPFVGRRDVCVFFLCCWESTFFVQLIGPLLEIKVVLQKELFWKTNVCYEAPGRL